MKPIQIKQIHSEKFYIEFTHDKQLNIYIFPTENFKGDFSKFDKKIDEALKEVFSKAIKNADEDLSKFNMKDALC